MKKVLVALLSFFLIISMISCSGDNPEPPKSDIIVEEDPPSQVDQVTDAVESLGDVFSSKENVTEEIDSQTGATVSTVKNDYTDPETGYTVKAGSKKTKGTGVSETVMNYTYTEAGKTVDVSDTTSTRLETVNEGTAAAITEDKLEEAETAIASAKEIPNQLFVESTEGDNVVYTYDPQNQAVTQSARMAKTAAVDITQDSITKVVVTYTYEGNRIEYTYDVTYTVSGNTVTVRETLVKETIIKVDNGEAEDLSQQLKEEFSLGQIQGGGKFEAIELAKKVSRNGSPDDTYSSTETNSLVFKDKAGKNLFAASATNRYSYSMEKTDNSYSYDDSTTTDLRFDHVDASLGIPFISSGSTLHVSQHSTSYSYATDDNSWVYTSDDTTELSLVTDGKTVLELNAAYNSSQEDDYSSTATTVSSTTILTIEKLISPINISETISFKAGDKIVVKTEDTYYEGDESVTKTEITLNNTSIELADLISSLASSELAASLKGLLAIINEGGSFELKSSGSQIDYYFADNYGSDEICRARMKEDSSVSGTVKPGLVDYFENVSGENPITPAEFLAYVNGLATNTSTYTFPERFEGVSQLILTDNSSSDGERTITIKIVGGPLQGIYADIPYDLYDRSNDYYTALNF